MTDEKSIYDPVEVGELAEEIDWALTHTSLLAAALRQIIKELPADLDAAKLAKLAVRCAVDAERDLNHLLERLKNGGVL